MSWQLPTKAAFHSSQDLLDVENVPVYQKNQYIMSGYRPMPQGAWRLWLTIFTLHNETGNMWTHLSAAIYFLMVGVQFGFKLLDYQEQHLLQEAIFVLVLIIATDFCLIASFIYHLCTCCPSGVCICAHKFDQVGIVTLIATSYFTGIALGYRCFPILRCSYLAYTACVVMALAAPLLQPGLITSIKRHFIICVALGVVPAVHWLCISSLSDIMAVAPYLLGMFGGYGLGACFFVSQWPERRWPGRFDLVGHSHQLWHMFVALAAGSWVNGMLMLLDRAGQTQCS